ncbi:hypothetical protein OBV_06810 [Oscillibacter valericigenes Sjm18-20]|nr:hypothetical protein OBV_06810 [Oscillibacter valericigenes Sjm18-20]
MRRSPEVHPKPADALVALAVLLLAAALTLTVWGGNKSGGLIATISVNGQVAKTVDLSRLSGPEVQEFTANGFTLHVRLSSDGAEVIDSTCPNQVCVHTGHISRAGQSIVCLPARISVTLSGGTANGVDAVLG